MESTNTSQADSAMCFENATSQSITLDGFSSPVVKVVYFMVLVILTFSGLITVYITQEALSTAGYDLVYYKTVAWSFAFSTLYTILYFGSFAWRYEPLN